MSLTQKLTQLAKSPQAKKLADRAQEFAKDPKNKEHVDKAKRKLAEMRSGGSTGGSTGTAGTKQDPPDGPRAA